jgi:hypothetical protein
LYAERASRAKRSADDDVDDDEDDEDADGEAYEDDTIAAVEIVNRRI